MSSLKRFVEAGLNDLETRFTSRLPVPARDHPLAVAVVASSSIGRVVSRGAQLLALAAESSVAAGFARSIVGAWTQAPAGVRHQSAGIALIAAVLVHVFLLWFHGLPAGWLWSIVPAMAAAIGIVLVLSGRGGSRAAPTKQGSPRVSESRVES